MTLKIYDKFTRRGQLIIYGLRYWMSDAELPGVRCQESRNFEKCYAKATELVVFFGINYVGRSIIYLPKQERR